MLWQFTIKVIRNMLLLLLDLTILVFFKVSWNLYWGTNRRNSPVGLCVYVYKYVCLYICIILYTVYFYHVLDSINARENKKINKGP